VDIPLTVIDDDIAEDATETINVNADPSSTYTVLGQGGKAQILDDSKMYYSEWQNTHKPDTERSPLRFLGELTSVEVSNENGQTTKTVLRYYTYDKWISNVGKRTSPTWDDATNDLTITVSISFGQSRERSLQVVVQPRVCRIVQSY
jgi:hypothetical protein